MRTIITGIIIFFLSGNLLAQTFCLRLIEESNDGNNLIVRIEVQGSAGFDLGSSNLQFSYNTAALGIPTLESSPLAPPLYQIPTVTTPAVGEASFNFELGFAGFGSTMAGSPGWTEVGQVNFPITDANNIGNMTWSYNGGTTQTIVFLDDETTQIFATTPACLEPLNLSPTPVELLFFRAIKQKDVAKLIWETSSETNNRGFEVLRSTDAMNWKKIGWVNGHGTTTIRHTYEMIDEFPSNGINYYKLKQIDFDGTETFTEVEVVKFESTFNIQLIPNPAKGVFQLVLPNHTEVGNIKIFDEFGRVLLESTTSQISYDISTYPAGTYLVVVGMDGKQFAEKLVIEP